MTGQNQSNQLEDGGYSLDQIYLLLGKVYADFYTSQEFVKQLRKMLLDKDTALRELEKQMSTLRLTESIQSKRVESLLNDKCVCKEGKCKVCKKDKEEEGSEITPETELGTEVLQ